MTDTAPTKSTDVLLGLVIDKSGSMYNQQAGVTEAIRSLLTEQAETEGTAYVSMVLFDTTFDARYVGMDAREIPPFGSPENPYRLGGGTALYDGVGVTIRGIDAWLAKRSDFDGKVLVAIMTDGEENSSSSHTIAQINEMISARQAKGWEFVFMGSGTAAWTEGKKFTAIPVNNNYSYDASSSATVSNYAGVSRSLSSSRLSGSTYGAAAADDEVLSTSVANTVSNR